MAITRTVTFRVSRAEGGAMIKYSLYFLIIIFPSSFSLPPPPYISLLFFIYFCLPIFFTSFFYHFQTPVSNTAVLSWRYRFITVWWYQMIALSSWNNSSVSLSNSLGPWPTQLCDGCFPAVLFFFLTSVLHLSSQSLLCFSLFYDFSFPEPS